MSELTPEQRAWVDALRSGEYKQGSSWLHKDDEFCCLGVACVLAIKSGVSVTVEMSGNITDYDEAYADLPESVRSWLGLRSRVGDIVDDSDPLWEGQRTLTSVNDSGASFASIAGIIEERAADLFEANP